MDKWWVLGNCDRTNAWLLMYPLDRRIRSSCSSLMMIFFICLNFFLCRPFGFSSSHSFLFLFFFFFFFFNSHFA